jgi:hypothetical protein
MSNCGFIFVFKNISNNREETYIIPNNFISEDESKFLISLRDKIFSETIIEPIITCLDEMIKNVNLNISNGEKFEYFKILFISEKF